jgi:hypothetical protein
MKIPWTVIVASVLVFDGSGRVHAQELSPHRPHLFDQPKHRVQRLNDEKEPEFLDAEIQCISEPWFRQNADEHAASPYLAYLPEKERVLMLVGKTQQPVRTAFIHSDDHGQTWSERRWLSTDAERRPEAVVLGLTNLGGGKLLAIPESLNRGLWSSSDYGESWKLLPADDAQNPRKTWDPMLVLRNADGRVTKLCQASWREGVPWGSPDYYSQASIRFSTDEGKTWSADAKVPEWLGVNEVNLIRAANGDLVAACRTDYPKRFAHHKFDQFDGLAVSVSKNEGKTWSDLKPLYEWGRHHPSLVLLPEGKLLMTYVVRLGYPATYQGIPQFGVEAVISRDHGQTWDKEHRYVLASWEGTITSGTAWWCGVQSTSTILLPDGMLLTVFGTGFRNPADVKVAKMDVALVRWRIDEQ